MFKKLVKRAEVKREERRLASEQFKYESVFGGSNFTSQARDYEFTKIVRDANEVLDRVAKNLNELKMENVIDTDRIDDVVKVADEIVKEIETDELTEIEQDKSEEFGKCLDNITDRLSKELDSKEEVDEIEQLVRFAYGEQIDFDEFESADYITL